VLFEGLKDSGIILVIEPSVEVTLEVFRRCVFREGFLFSYEDFRNRLLLVLNLVS